MDLDTHKHRDVEPGWHLSRRERDTDLTHTKTLLGDTEQWLNTDVHDVTSGHQRCNKTQQILKCSGLTPNTIPICTMLTKVKAMYRKTHISACCFIELEHLTYFSWKKEVDVDRNFLGNAGM